MNTHKKNRERSRTEVFGDIKDPLECDMNVFVSLTSLKSRSPEILITE